MRRVAVLMGGVSSEREISLLSGAAVVEALRGEGYAVTPIILEREELEALPDGIEAVFLALHGGYGENGGVQAALNRLGVPYTGPGAEASRTAMDKIATKRLLLATGVPTPAYQVVARGASTSLPLPVVVKPPRDGSSVGITKVEHERDLAAALKLAQELDAQGEALVEEYVPGREWTVGIVDGWALPVVEVRAAQGWYGFTEKYRSGTTEYHFPEGVEDAPVVGVCQALALAAYVGVGCRGVARVDFRVTDQGEPWVLEINTAPGFTVSSLLPKAARRAGMDFGKLCVKLLDCARCD